MASVLFQVMWLFSLLLPAAAVVARASEASKNKVDVNYVTEMLDKLKGFVTKQTTASQDHFANEVARLQKAMASAPVGLNQDLLAETLKQVETERIEAEAASLEAMQHYHTVRAALGSRSGAPSCDFLTCGRHAVCRSKEGGRAFCECAPCFKGDGFTCRPAPCTSDTFYASLPIVPSAREGVKPDPVSAKEISLAVLGKDRVVVAMRDEQRGSRGFMMVGTIASMEISWGDWQPFSGESKAFAPVVAGFDNGRVLVSYRDALEHGVGFLLSGQIESSDSDLLKVALGMPHGFVKEQEQKVALVPVSSSRVVCLYANHVAGQQSGGGAALVQLLPDGVLSLLGKYHFAESVPISYIAATKLTEFSFVVAYRALPPEGVSTGMSSKELSAQWMQVSDDNMLVVDPHALALEGTRPDMLQRDVALVSHNLFAYSYFSNSEKQTKTILVRVEPGGSLMTQVGAPTVIGRGFTSFVGAISLPAGAQTPSTFTYFQPPNKHSLAGVCGVTSDSRISACKDLLWADSELEAAVGTRLADGRLLFAFIDPAGTASTRFLSAEEASALDINTAVV